MARLDVDLIAIQARGLLNEHKRDEAKKLVLRELAEGRARPDTQRVAAELFGAGKGRQRTGLFRWIDIGRENAELEMAGVPYAVRLEQLSAKFGRGQKHIEACIAEFNKAEEAGRT
ncbi:MAG: hypothetical protein ABI398_06235 [Devosia sp.]